jgi:hypothetical protein
MNYTHAYSTFAIRSCLNPELPNNFGSLAPIKVVAPEGCIVNCKYPAPVNARHVVGMYVSMPVLKALYHVIPDRVLAEGSGAVWTIQIQGKDRNGDPFTSSMFNYSGGMGARLTKPGPSATCYPTGVAAVPVEVLEAAARGFRRRRKVARRRRAGDRVAHAHQCHMAAQRGAEPHQPSAGRTGRRRGRIGRQISRQRKACERGPQTGDAGRRSGHAGDARRRRIREGVGVRLCSPTFPLSSRFSLRSSGMISWISCVKTRSSPP